MNLKIGAIIKKLRTENNVTQDALATALGVTPQAISRWEAEGGYPDIELLPMLADFFSVSTDELLGYRLSEREETLANIKKEMERLSEVSTIDERIAFARESLSRYPYDNEIRNNLAVCLYQLWDDTQDKSILPETEALCQAVIEDCKNENTRYNSITTLSCIYAALKQPDKARATLDLLTPMKYCREEAKSMGIGDGNAEVYIQDEIHKLTDHLGTAIHNLVLNEELPNDPSTWSKKIEMMKVSNEIYRMIYGENLMFYHTRLAFSHWIISTYQMSQGKLEDALCSLEEMCRHAVAYDESYQNDHGKHYTSIFTDKIVYPEPSENFHELSEHSQCYYMLDRLTSKRYDPIREDARFIAVKEALQAYSR